MLCCPLNKINENSKNLNKKHIRNYAKQINKRHIQNTKKLQWYIQVSLNSPHVNTWSIHPWKLIQYGMC